MASDPTPQLVVPDGFRYVDRPFDSAPQTPFEIHDKIERENVRVPSELAPAGKPVDVGAIEAAVVFGQISRLVSMTGQRPNLSTLREVCHMSDARLAGTDRAGNGLGGILGRLVAEGSIWAQKLPYRYGEGARDFSAAWRFGPIDDGPAARALKRGYTQVPMEVATSRSVMLTAGYLLFAEQQFRDGGVATTCSDVQRALRCSRRTAQRIIHACDVEPVIEPAPGRFIGLMRLLWWGRARRTTVKVAGQQAWVHASAADRLTARHRRLREALATIVDDVELVEAEAARAITDALHPGEQMHLQMLTRYLELRYQRLLATTTNYAGRLENRFASRVRGLGFKRGPLGVPNRAAVRKRCFSCERCDDGWVDVLDEHGHVRSDVCYGPEPPG